MPQYTPTYRIPYVSMYDPYYDLPATDKAMATRVEAILASLSVDPAPLVAFRVVPSATARDAAFGTPQTATTQRALQDRGPVVVRLDTGTVERYYAAYHSTNNPGGADTAGWYALNAARRTIAVTYAAGYDSSGTPGQAYITVANGMVHFEGGFTKLSGNFDSTYVTVGTYPAEFAPARRRYLAGMGAAGRAGGLQFNTNGQIVVSFNVGGTPWVGGAHSWPLSS
ncbi:hypothetical protein [Mycetocola reblochoni]|uniref:hypothetical protein n=1 Tax=Mycetocola reblochoni TaxID=331618 RepID=UPI003F98356F